MARRDPTFTGGDVIRFWCRNLDEEEQLQVASFFLYIAPIFFDPTGIVENFVAPTNILERLAQLLNIRFRGILPQLAQRVEQSPRATLQDLLRLFSRTERQQVMSCINEQMRDARQRGR